MAESGRGGAQEKTEPPTSKRLRDARRQGDVWQSRDFSATIAIVVFALAALLGAPQAFAWLAAHSSDTVLTATRPDVQVAQRVRAVLMPLALWTVVAASASVLVSIVASAVQVGPVMAFGRIGIDAKRLNPIEGLKRIVAWRTVIEGIRLAVKLLALGGVLVVLARGQLPMLARAGHLPAIAWLGFGARQFEALLLSSCLIFGAVAVADLVYQRWDYMRRHRMSKDDVRRESKEREGDPILRGRRKQLHQEINFNDMLHRVRKASVVVVNPTHVAVALHYDPQFTPIPMVVAKGEGEVARAIREAAEQAGVPIYRDVSLARALQGGAPIDDYIPDDLIEAVAQVLRWVERMKRQEAGPAA